MLHWRNWLTRLPFTQEILGSYPRCSTKVHIPDRWVKLALEIWVIRKFYHISLAGVVIIECASRKNSHRLKLKYIERDGTELYFKLN